MTNFWLRAYVKGIALVWVMGIWSVGHFLVRLGFCDIIEQTLYRLFYCDWSCTSNFRRYNKWYLSIDKSLQTRL